MRKLFRRKSQLPVTGHIMDAQEVAEVKAFAEEYEQPGQDILQEVGENSRFNARLLGCFGGTVIILGIISTVGEAAYVATKTSDGLTAPKIAIFGGIGAFAAISAFCVLGMAKGYNKTSKDHFMVRSLRKAKKISNGIDQPERSIIRKEP